MFNILSETVREANEEHGFGTAIFALIILLGVIFALLSGIVWVAMLLWNGVLIALFPAIGAITFWQMWGLYLLFDILLKPSASSSKK